MHKLLMFSVLGCLALATPTTATNLERRSMGMFTLTAYTGSHQKHTKIPITASGRIARAGHTIAVDPKVIALDSLVEIDGLGVRRSEDTGGRIKGKKIDVYVENVLVAKRFGVQRAEVFYLSSSRE